MAVDHLHVTTINPNKYQRVYQAVIAEMHPQGLPLYSISEIVKIPQLIQNLMN